MNGLKIRPATDADAVALHELAVLDSQVWDRGDALVAEVEGELWAALPLDGRPPVANPFRATADLVALLQLRREQLAQAQARPRRPAGRRLLRFPARA
jgi:hypothetical protein